MLTMVDTLASALAAPNEIPRMKPADFATPDEYRAHAEKRRKYLEAEREKKRIRKGRTHPQRDREQAERQARENNTMRSSLDLVRRSHLHNCLILRLDCKCKSHPSISTT